jgi:flagellar assembly protein FliH
VKSVRPPISTSFIRESSPAERSSRSAGTVLRGVTLDGEPLLLPRPGVRSSPQPDLKRPASDAGVPPETTALFRQGYEAAKAEAARSSESEEARRRGYDAGFTRGVQEGREQGLAEGLAEGRAAGHQEVAREARAAADAATERLARLDALLSELPAQLARRLEEAEDDMVALCHAAVCRILGDALVTSDGVAQAVRQAVRDACSGRSVVGGDAALAIHVHPRELEALRTDERLAAWLDQAQAVSGGLRWVGDDRVQVGGCLVSSGEGTLDARLEVQMAALRDLLVRHREPTDPSGGNRESSGN